MTPFKRFTGLAAPLDRADVDTDQIIPKQFLKRVERSGFGRYLFYDWRTHRDGTPNPEFVLNRPRYRGAQVLLARENFGCGSSREHAVWALLDYGFRAVIAPSFADIFKTNCFKNGLLPIELDGSLVDEWFRRVEAQVGEGVRPSRRDSLLGARTPSPKGYRITVDLEAQTLTGSDGFACSFEIDPFRRRCLLEGLDEIALTLRHEAAIAAYEEAHQEPWQAATAM